MKRFIFLCSFKALVVCKDGALNGVCHNDRQVFALYRYIKVYLLILRLPSGFNSIVKEIAENNTDFIIGKARQGIVFNSRLYLNTLALTYGDFCVCYCVETVIIRLYKSDYALQLIFLDSRLS